MAVILEIDTFGGRADQSGRGNHRHRRGGTIGAVTPVQIGLPGAPAQPMGATGNPVLLVLALLVQRMRMRKGTIEEAKGDETEAASVQVAKKKRVPIRESRGQREVPRIVRSATVARPVARRWQPQVAATTRDMRRGIVLMAVLGPCRGLEPCSVTSELDRG